MSRLPPDVEARPGHSPSTICERLAIRHKVAPKTPHRAAAPQPSVTKSQRQCGSGRSRRPLNEISLRRPRTAAGSAHRSWPSTVGKLARAADGNRSMHVSSRPAALAIETQRILKVLLSSDPGPRMRAEFHREIRGTRGEPVDVDEAIDAVYGAGLIHAQEDLVIPTRRTVDGRAAPVGQRAACGRSSDDGRSQHTTEPGLARYLPRRAALRAPASAAGRVPWASDPDRPHQLGVRHPRERTSH